MYSMFSGLILTELLKISPWNISHEITIIIMNIGILNIVHRRFVYVNDMNGFE